MVINFFHDYKAEFMADRKATFAKRQRETELKDRAREKDARRQARRSQPRVTKGPEIAWDEAVRYTESRANLDLNILYRFTRRYSVYFDWANILNAPDGIDYQYKDTFVRTNNPTGSRYNLGFRAKL